ncbi:hypothetical protein [Persicitalea sp.]|uniref:hypothetical protein n=1 Tax=Persicitalea sp. TaxID=3100273 RepID=UPI003593C8DC
MNNVGRKVGGGAVKNGPLCLVRSFTNSAQRGNDKKGLYRYFRRRWAVHEEFSDDTIPFFEAVDQGSFIIIVSDLLEAELLRAPKHVREFLNMLPVQQIEKIRPTREESELADRYIVAKVVGQTSRADCQYIAIATITKADVLVSDRRPVGILNTS